MLPRRRLRSGASGRLLSAARHAALTRRIDPVEDCHGVPLSGDVAGGMPTAPARQALVDDAATTSNGAGRVEDISPLVLSAESHQWRIGDVRTWPGASAFVSGEQSASSSEGSNVPVAGDSFQLLRYKSEFIIHPKVQRVTDTKTF